MSIATPPPVPRIVLGMELASWRSKADVTGQQAAAKIGKSSSQISKIENGGVPISEEDLLRLLELYGVPDQDRPSLVELARATHQSAWWDAYRDVITGARRLDTYLALEQAADELRSLEIWLIHGLLQTEAYASAMIRAARPGAGRHVFDRAIALRMQRKVVLKRSGFRLHVILDEAALRRPIGGETTMYAQLQHLREMSQKPNVTIQVLPQRLGAHPGTDGPFTIVTFARKTPRPDDWHIAYVGSELGNLYETEPADVLPKLDRFEKIQDLALSVDDSDAFIDAIAQEFM